MFKSSVQKETLIQKLLELKGGASLSDTLKRIFKKVHSAPQLVGVCGSVHNVGTTHISLALCNYMSNKCMYRTAYVELNGTHEILSLSKTADEKVFTYKNVDFFPHAVMSTLTEILNMRYERVIIDFGILNPNTLKEFMRCDVRIAVCTISKWNRGALNRIIELFNYKTKY